MKHSIRTALVVILFVSFAAGLVVAAESIPFSLKRGIPEIEVIINDSIKASFVIDTGADHIYIDKTFAEKHGLLSGRTRPMRPTRGSKGSTEAKLFSVESLKFGDISLSDLSIVSIDLVSQIKDTFMGYTNGGLG
ncbi:MAG: retropepsin-like domain-containing protein, partial [candidate division Zixibacteria bacterium]|nr:retropepsin-like domain-containing protein [candidate division Zixibacteria bacterium]